MYPTDIFRTTDKHIVLVFSQWGSIPVKGPNGNSPGSGVLIEQSEGPIAISAERHFLPVQASFNRSIRLRIRASWLAAKKWC
jgi:hypothetical protein